MTDYHDDWETDPEPANPLSEKEKRWGAKTLPDDALHKEPVSLHEIRERVVAQDNYVRQVSNYEPATFILHHSFFVLIYYYFVCHLCSYMFLFFFFFFLKKNWIVVLMGYHFVSLTNRSNMTKTNPNTGRRSPSERHLRRKQKRSKKLFASSYKPIHVVFFY